MVVAQDLGVTQWDARHDSSAFAFTRPFAMTAVGNTIALWKREQFGLELVPDLDEVSLALVADAWSRTFRSRVFTYAEGAGAQITRGGLRILPDQILASWPVGQRLASLSRPPSQELDQALRAIADRYGTPTADLVAMQLEYPR